MITTYLLKNCKYCKDLLKYIKNNPNVNICLIIVSQEDIPLIRENEPRIKEFPVAFTGNPKNNGLPYKNSHMISGSSIILETLKNNFGKKLTGNSLKIKYDYDNQKNISSLNNIRKHRNNCFGNTCHIMDRPFGPTDNQYILQGYQPECALPIRSDLPIKYKNDFGITTPGTHQWKNERKPWPAPKILINDNNHSQNTNANKKLGINVPRTYSNDYLNQKIWNPLNNFGNGQFISGPINQTAPFLTYAAGGNGISRVTGKNYLREQIPIERSPTTTFISGNIKDYVNKQPDKQKFLYDGLDSNWSINAQGINKYGKSKYGNVNNWELTRTVSGNGENQSQYFKRQRFVDNGNSYGTSNNKKKMSLKPKNPKQKQKQYKIKEQKIKEPKIKVQKNKRPKKQMKFTSPLGIEISFN